LLFIQNTKAIIWKTVADGSWNDGSIWFGGIAPPSSSSSDTFFIYNKVLIGNNLSLDTNALLQIEINGGICGHYKITVNKGAKLVKYGILSLDAIITSGGSVSLYPPGPFVSTETFVLNGHGGAFGCPIEIGFWFKCMFGDNLSTEIPDSSSCQLKLHAKRDSLERKNNPPKSPTWEPKYEHGFTQTTNLPLHVKSIIIDTTFTHHSGNMVFNGFPYNKFKKWPDNYDYKHDTIEQTVTIRSMVFDNDFTLTYFKKKYTSILGLSESDSLHFLQTGNRYKGICKSIYKQYYKGIEVEGADITLVETDDTIKSLHGTVVKNFNCKTAPKVSEVKAFEIALEAKEEQQNRKGNLNQKDKIIPLKNDTNMMKYSKAKLLLVALPFFNTNPKTFKLAYKFIISSTAVYVNAFSGKVIRISSLSRK